MAVTVSARGQMVIPAKLRRKYGIRISSKVEVVDTGEELVLVPIPRKPFEESRGILKGVSVADLLRARRAERNAEARRDRR